MVDVDRPKYACVETNMYRCRLEEGARAENLIINELNSCNSLFCKLFFYILGLGKSKRLR